MSANALPPKTPSLPDPNARCDFPGVSDAGRDRYWHGCGQLNGEHIQLRLGDRYVAYVPPQVPWPCRIVDLDPLGDRLVALTREQMRERYARNRAAQYLDRKSDAALAALLPPEAVR